MTTRHGFSAALLFGVFTLSACGGSPVHQEWTGKKDDPAKAAFNECDDQTDTTMRLRGYPTDPLPETPQASFRKTTFDQCMRRKGYEQD